MFRPWTFRIASREAFRHLKKRRAWMEKHEDDFHFDNLPSPEIRPSGEELLELLAIGEISPASRAVLMLHFHEDPPIAEVAAIFDIPLGTAKSHLAYGLASIRKHKKNGGSHG